MKHVKRWRSGAHLAIGALVAVVCATGVASSTPASAAGQQSCLAEDICVAYQGAGSIIYGYVSDSINLTGVSYSNSVTVNNNVGFGRSRESSYVRVCFREGLNQTGSTLINAPYSGATWVVDSTSTWASSSFFATNGSC